MNHCIVPVYIYYYAQTINIVNGKTFSDYGCCIHVHTCTNSSLRAVVQCQSLWLIQGLISRKYIHAYIHTVSGFSACQCSCLSLVLGLGPSFGSRTIRRVVSICGMEVKQQYSVICEHEYVVLIVYIQSGEELVY